MRRIPGMALLLTGAVLLTGCGSNDTSVTPKASATQAPEDVTTTAAAVKIGLNKIVTIAADIKANISDKSKAEAGYGSIEPIWLTIEGTVKKNDSNTYIALEDAFALLENAAKSADTAKATSGSDAVSSTVTGYLAKFPA